MTKQLPQRDSPDKAVDHASGEHSSMQRFSDLARSVVNVSRERLKEEEEKYAVENAARKNRVNRP